MVHEARDEGQAGARARGHRRRSLVLGAISLLLGASVTPLTALTPAALIAPADAAVGQGFNLNASDLKFILKQIKISEAHAARFTPTNFQQGDQCAALIGPGQFQIPEGPQAVELPWGLRTVDGGCNNLVSGQSRYGAADRPFPRSAGTDHRDAEPGIPASGTPGSPGFFPGFPGNAIDGGPTSYARSGSVVDSEPRRISNLIVDQTAANPAAREVSGAAPGTTGSLFIQNTAPDVGLSAPYNSWFTLFGQFFDHGLDLVNKGGAGTVMMPLAPDDPLYASTPPAQRFMVLTRATGSPGEATNRTAPWVDQSQTYASHPSHQVFLREYADSATGPVSDGMLLEGTVNTGPNGAAVKDGMATWATVKHQATTLLGIELDDLDVLNVPLVATDPYGKFLPGAGGLPQLVLQDGSLVSGNLDAPVDATRAKRTGHAFLDDIAHGAAPFGDHDNDPSTPRRALLPDADTAAGADDGLPGTYDDELLAEHFVAGDGRVNENIGLTAVHHVFHAEHNRLAAEPSDGGSSIKDVLTKEDPDSVAEWKLPNGEWNGERIFQAARFVTEMEYQHLAFEEFARKVQPMVNPFGGGGTGYNSHLDPAIRAEFAHAVYRFGHSMLTETVARTEADGTAKDMSLLAAFLNPVAFDDGGTVAPSVAAGRIVRGMTRQTGNEIDEFVTESLRNELLGLPLDLAAINLARARETGVPRLNTVRERFFAATGNSALKPYASWADFGLGLRNPESLTNFVAAYGKHPTIVGSLSDRRAAATRIVTGTADAPADAYDFLNSTGTWATQPTGLRDVDLWMGGLAEKGTVFGGLLGSTFNYVFEMQMEDLQFGDRFYYLSRTAGLNLLTQLEGNSFAELISRTTDVSNLPADSFSRPDFIFDVGALTQQPAPTITDDPTTSYVESDRTKDPGQFLSRTPDGTLRYAGPAHTVFNGTAGADKLRASEGDDTLRGNGGGDTMEGGDGADHLIGGEGDDLLQDLFGDDVLKGGDGDDALSSGQGFGGDLNQGGRGDDYVRGGNDATETFAGPGNDLVHAGDGDDTVFGDDGDDWIEGGGGAFNLLQGDNGAPFQDDPNKAGHDVLDGDGGEQDFDGEGGDDIMLSGPGVQRAEGMLGFDWFTHQGDPEAANTDMKFLGILPPSLVALRDRFDLVEAVSGWDKDDVLRGDDRTADDVVAAGDQPIAQGHALEAEGIARISGLQDVLGTGVTSFAAGNIILGGDGSDTLEGRGGNDILDGDRWLKVRLSVRTDVRDPGTETRTVDNVRALEADIFARRVDPGQVVIVREVLPGNGNGHDRALFSDVRAAYTCADASGAIDPCPISWSGGRLTVSHPAEGTDTLLRIEELVFSDSVAPNAPSTVTAVAGSRVARVNWDLPVSVVDSFEVQTLTAAGAPVGAPTAVDGPETTTFLVTGLTNGETYRFRVRAVNAFGTGAWSTPSNAVTPRSTVPATPGLPTATAGDRQAAVSWTAPDDGGEPITSYDVRVSDVSGAQVGLLRQTTRTSLTVSGLTNGSQYSFAVRAHNPVGPGGWSNESLLVTPRAPVTPPADPGPGQGGPGAPTQTAPGTPHLASATAGRSRVTLVFAAPTNDGGSPVLRYAAQVLDHSGQQVGALRTVAPSARSMVVSGLTNGLVYGFRIRAENAVADGGWSAAVTATPSGPPLAPVLTDLAPRATSVTLRWKAPASDGGAAITSYRIMVKTAAGKRVGPLRVVNGSARKVVVRGLAPGTRYQFRVQAQNSLGRSAFASRMARTRP